MKDFWKSWKFWAVVVAVLLVIAAIVLYFTCPKFAFAASSLLIGGLAGFIWGYAVGSKKADSDKK